MASQTIHTYIYFPENLDEHIDTTENGQKIIENFQMAIDLADCEIGSILHYSKSNKDLFFENISAYEELSKLNIGAYDLETYTNSLFVENNIFAVNEETNPNCKAISYNAKTDNLDRDIPKLFYDAVTKHINPAESDRQIILNLFNWYFSQNPIMIIVNCNGDAQNYSIPFVTNFKEFDEWLQENRLTRNFNNTDTRHIENSGNHRRDRNTGEYKSPLLGGIGGRENAQTFLKAAVGDKRSDSNKEDIINYDTVNQQYIWYEFENTNPQNQYHGYHLVKAFTYEEDTIAIGRIPNRVQKILDYRKKQSN